LPVPVPVAVPSPAAELARVPRLARRPGGGRPRSKGIASVAASVVRSAVDSDPESESVLFI
jgi:hypothetical protein